MIIAVVIVAFFADVFLKIASRMVPTIVGRFSFTTGIGDFGIIPSTNTVLAFSLPIPNAWIWPVGWLLIAVLIMRLSTREENTKSEYRNSKQIRMFEIRISKLFRISDFGFRISHRRLSMLMVILGAVSNLIDRTVFGGVTDYISFSDLYPAFNIADILIIAGIVWWMLAMRVPHGQVTNKKRTP